MIPSKTESGDAASWLARKYFDEISLQFRTAWDIYIKWYTVFLTANVLALAGAVQYVEPDNRLIVAITFCIQNVLALLTAVYMALFSRRTAERIRAVSVAIASEDGPGDHGGVVLRLGGSPVPGDLGYWSGWANAIGNASLIGCWIATLFVAG